MFKRLISLFLALSIPFILSAGKIDLSTDSHPMSGGFIEYTETIIEEVDDVDIFEIIIAVVAVVGTLLLFGEDIFKDGRSFWEAFL